MALQSFVSIGVNLGLLPTKGLTLPLVSSGGSSVLMTCAAMGVLLRVSYELDRAERQVARLRGEAGTRDPGPGTREAHAGPTPRTAPPMHTGHATETATNRAPNPETRMPASRGTSRLRERIEPVMGAGIAGLRKTK